MEKHIKMVIDQIRELIHLKRKEPKGATCPVCDQRVKEYKRKLNSTMAAGMIILVREYRRTGEWVYIPKIFPKKILASGGYFTVVRHWGLAVNREPDDDSKRTSGFWKPTEEGMSFVDGKIEMPSHVYLYNNAPIGWEKTTTTNIHEALGKKFHYRELMSAEGLR